MDIDRDNKYNELTRYIAFDGLDGSGKSTQAKLLNNYLVNSDLSKEPTDNEIGKLIRRCLNKEFELTPYVLDELFKLDRLEHEKEIKELNSNGIISISDRSIISGIVYNQSDKSIIQLIEENILRLLPSTLIYIKVSIDTVLSRIEKRNKELNQDNDLYENREALSRLEARFDSVITYFQSLNLINCIIIDGEQSPEKIHKDILNALNI